MAEVQAHDDGNRPPLPVAVPVERNGHGTEPRADERTEEPAEGLVEGSEGTRHGE